MNDQSAGTPLFTFAIITDTHIRPAELDQSSPFPVNELANDRARFAIAAIKEAAPAFVLHLGDMVHPLPHLPTFRAACSEAHDIFAPVRDALHFIPGNHDIGDKPNPDAPAGPADDETISQYESEFGPSRSSFEHNGCLFVLINSSLVNSRTPQEADQKAWLQATLASGKDRRIFLCSHYPPFIYAPNEQSHYDNYAEPGRSWLLDLVKQYNVEAVFSGHVHQYFYNRVGQSRLYCLMPTSFIRQDYAEMYAIEPPKEFGRNDEGKFGYALVDVYADGHRVRVVPTDGATLAKGAALRDDRPLWQTAPSTALTVPLRHAWATPIDLPYNGPMEEFARKRTRNDYTLMRLQQMGLTNVRAPLTDLLDSDIRRRVDDFHGCGVRFSFFCIGTPGRAALDTVREYRHLVTQLELVSATDDLVDIADSIANLAAPDGLRLMIGKSHSSKHEPEQGSKFAHSVSSGFKWEQRETVLAALHLLKDNVRVAGLVFQLNLTDDLRARLQEMDAFATANDIKIDANVRLANANPAVANFDDVAIAARVCEARSLAATLESVKVHLDTFVDIDRGYNPRHGLLDRHYNLRPAGRALAMCQDQ